MVGGRGAARNKRAIKARLSAPPGSPCRIAPGAPAFQQRGRVISPRPMTFAHQVISHRFDHAKRRLVLGGSGGTLSPISGFGHVVAALVRVGLIVEMRHGAARNAA